MRYQGGKSRIAREISELISALRGGYVYKLILRLVRRRGESQRL